MSRYRVTGEPVQDLVMEILSIIIYNIYNIYRPVLGGTVAHHRAAASIRVAGVAVSSLGTAGVLQLST